MAALKKWGVYNNRIINIDSIDKSNRDMFKGTVTCCCGCGNVLVPNMGEKKDRYFRVLNETHKCQGSTESMLHRLTKQIIADAGVFHVPEEMIVVGKGLKFINSSRDILFKPEDVYLEEKIGDIITDVTIKTDDLTVFIEVYVAHKITAAKLNKYRKFDFPFVVVELDMRKYFRHMDNVSYEELQLSVLNSENITSTVIMSDFMADIQAKYQETIHYMDSDKTICPVTNGVMDVKSKCRKCEFYIGRKETGVYYCTGKQLRVKKSDYSKNSEYEDRYDLYIDDIPQSDGEVHFKKDDMFGYCSTCGKPLEMARGTETKYGESKAVKMIPIVRVDDSTAHLYCRFCDTLYDIYCPKCVMEYNASHAKEFNSTNDKLKSLVLHQEAVRDKRYQSVCVMNLVKRVKGYQKSVVLSCFNFNPSAEEEPCKTSLRLWTSEPVGNNFTKTFKEIGNIQNFLNMFDSRSSRSKVEKIIDKYKAEDM